MKNITPLFLLWITSSAYIAGDASAKAAAVQTQQAQATAHTQCATGDACAKLVSEDKQMLRVEQDRERRKGLDKHGADSERWGNPVYSDATRPEDLQLLLVKSAGLTMRLAPKLGIVYFDKPGQSHAFKIAAAPGEPGAMCPKYNFKVISASDRHALINMKCPAFEYKANRSSMSSEFILYDAQTATTKSIWFATAGKGEKFPYADPTPDVKVEKNGYRFQWTGIHPGTSTDPITLNSSFTIARDPQTGKGYLECRDLRLPKAEQIHSEVCQGLMLHALPATKK